MPGPRRRPGGEMSVHARRRVALAGAALAIGAAAWAAGCGDGDAPPRAGAAAGRTTVWVAPGVPARARAALRAAVRAAPNRFALVPAADTAELRVAVAPGGRPADGGSGRTPLASLVLVPVAPFPTIADGVSWAAVRRFWRGDGRGLAGLTGGGAAPELLVTAEARADADGAARPARPLGAGPHRRAAAPGGRRPGTRARGRSCPSTSCARAGRRWPWTAATPSTGASTSPAIRWPRASSPPGRATPPWRCAAGSPAAAP